MQWRIKQPKPGTPGRTPSLFDKCTGLFNMRYTTHGTNGFTFRLKDEAMVKCLALGHKCHGWAFEPTLAWSRTPEFEFGALNHSATTLPYISCSDRIALIDFLLKTIRAYCLKRWVEGEMGSIPSRTRYGNRSFSFATHTLWINLPIHIRASTTLDSFKTALKTHLFKSI